MYHNQLNEAGITKCCNDIEAKSVLNLSNINLIISISSSLEFKNLKIYEKVNVVIYNYENNQIYKSSKIILEININILDKYPKFINIIDELIQIYKSSKNYFYEGCYLKLIIYQKYYGFD